MVKFLAALSFTLLCTSFLLVEVAFCQQLEPAVSLFYPRPNGRIGDVAVLPSGQIIFTNYPVKPGRIWLLNQTWEVTLYESYSSAQDFYGVAVSPTGDIYFSVSSTGEIYKLSQSGNQTLFFRRSVKNVGAIAFAPNGTLFLAEMTASEGTQSIYKLTADASGNLTEALAFKAPHSIGGIAFNSKGELFYSDGPRGRLWKIVNGTSELFVNKKTWASMYGIAFDAADNLYLCDWSTPGNIYYVDFNSLNLNYKILDANNAALNGAKVTINLPNATTITLTSNTSGYIAINRTPPGNYNLTVNWQNVTVGTFTFNELSNTNKNLTCNVYNAKLTATDSQNKPLNNATLTIQLPNGTTITTTSPASLPSTPTGTLKATVTYNQTQLAQLTINLTNNTDTTIQCPVHTLTIEITDNNQPINNTQIEIQNENNTTITKQTLQTANLTIDGLLTGKYYITVKLKGTTIAQTQILLNNTQTLPLKANVTDLTITAKDLLGFPMQDANVTLTLPDDITLTGNIDKNGELSIKQLPPLTAKITVNTAIEKYTLTINLATTTQAATTFFISTATTTATAAIVIALLIIIPKTRHAITKLLRSIHIEVTSETENTTEWYTNILTSKGLNIQEAKQIQNGQTKILIEGNTLPKLAETTDHTAFLIADKTVMPQRKEIHIIKQLQNLKQDTEALSNITNTYTQQTNIKTIGILICNQVTDDMLNTLKTLPTTQEIVLMPKNQTQTTETEP